MARHAVRAIRPKEVVLVSDLLAAEHPDADALARAILRAINVYRAGEPTWVRVVRDGSAAVFYGPYPSAEAARTDHLSAGTLLHGTGPMFVVALVPPYQYVPEPS